MEINGVDITTRIAGDAAAPRDFNDAAKQFEEVLLRELIAVMTKELFDNSLLGEDAPAWSTSYQDMQRDVVTDQLASQLASSGRIGIARLLIEQHERANTAVSAVAEHLNSPAHIRNDDND